MASFTNFATLSYNGGTTNSNIVTGEILEALTAVKTAVSANYSAGDRITYALSLVNTGTAAITDYTVTDNLGGYTVGANTVYPLAYNAGTVRYYINGVLQTPPTVTAGPPLTVTGLTVPAGGSAVLIYETTATPVAPLATGSSITNTATITGGGLTTPITAQATVETANSADLTISKGPPRRRPLRKTARSPTRSSFPTPAIPKRRRPGQCCRHRHVRPHSPQHRRHLQRHGMDGGHELHLQRRDRRFHNAGRTDHRSGGLVHAEHRRDVHRNARYGHARHHRYGLTIHRTNDSVPGFGRGLSLPKKHFPFRCFHGIIAAIYAFRQTVHILDGVRETYGKENLLSYLRADMGV